MKTEFIRVIPVLPSADIERDVKWYKEKIGFELYYADTMYAVIFREKIVVHLQWHADTMDDPLLGGSVIRLFVTNINEIFQELVSRGTVKSDSLRLNTPWDTNEFGFYDLNNNAVIVMEDIVKVQ